jgi:hypothetical protein
MREEESLDLLLRTGLPVGATARVRVKDLIDRWLKQRKSFSLSLRRSGDRESAEEFDEATEEMHERYLGMLSGKAPA